MATKVYKIEIMVIDHDDLGKEEIKNVIENTKYPKLCISPDVRSIKGREVEWTDEHPLNNCGTSARAYTDLFAITTTEPAE